MTTSRTHRSVPLLIVAAVAGIGGVLCAADAAADADPLTGHYLVQHSTDLPAPLFIEVQATDGDEEVTHLLRCVLPKGEKSQQINCPQIGATAPVDLDEAGQHSSVIAVDFLPIEIRLASLGLDVAQMEESAEPQIHAAEAEWKGSPIGWECTIEDGDQVKCDTACGGPGTVTAEPYPANPMNPNMEPQCEVTCECSNGNTDTWIDSPQVVPAF